MDYIVSIIAALIAASIVTFALMMTHSLFGWPGVCLAIIILSNPFRVMP